MNRPRNILRGLFVLLIVLLLFYLNKKTGVNLETIARFKLETLNKVRSDSLDNKDKLNLLIQETTKLNQQIDEDSSHARDVINYLIIVVGLFIVSEVIFSVNSKRTSIDKDQD